MKKKESKTKRIKCPWCGRINVAITLKGGMAPHVDPSGKRCYGIGIAPPRTSE